MVWLFLKNYCVNQTTFHSDSCSRDSTFCLNGGTCEVTITGARYHCPARYQGDRCDTCADGHYGDACSKLFKLRFCFFLILNVKFFWQTRKWQTLRWKGLDLYRLLYECLCPKCLIHAIWLNFLNFEKPNWLFSDVMFVQHDGKFCTGPNLETTERSVEECRTRCINHDNCSAFVHNGVNCRITSSSCKTFSYSDDVTSYVKTVM